MKNPFLTGTTFYLRALDNSDLQGDYISWLNDPEVCEFNSHHVYPYNESQAVAYIKNSINSATDIILAIIDKTTETHIGNISLQKINLFHRNGEIAFLLGNKNYWGKGISYEAAMLLMKHGFTALGLHRIYCGTFSNNIRMQKLALKLGMKEEGRKRQSVFKNGQFVDQIDYGILKEEYKI